MTVYNRLIPTLLLKDGGIVKGVKYKNHKYIGDPINIVKILNDKEVDEILLLDIDKKDKNYCIDYDFIKDIISEAFMPVSYGGGISTIEQAKMIFSCGVEKIVICTSVHQNKSLVKNLINIFGSQSVVCSIDFKENIFRKKMVYINNGQKSTGINLFDYLNIIKKFKFGEIILNNIDRDGTRKGFDIELINKINNFCDSQIIASCGASSLSDFEKVFDKTEVNAVAAGSIFVFKGSSNSILINYPSQEIFNRKKL